MLFNIWVTSSCNMNCNYCYEGMNKKNYVMSKEMAYKTLAYINRKLTKINIGTPIIVNFHGGEPLIAFDIIEFMVNSLKETCSNTKHNIYFGLTTNGLLLSEPISRFLCENFQYSLSLSLDGDKCINDLNRKLLNGAGTHDLIIDNFKKIVVKRPDARGRITFTPETVRELYNSVNYLYDLGFRVIVPVADYSDERWDDAAVKVFEKQCIKIRNKFAADCFVKEKLFISIMREDQNRLKNGICDPENCSVNIFTDGNLYPCSFVVGDGAFIIGDISFGVDKIKLNKLYEISTKRNGECEGCTNYDYCIGTRCKLINKVYTGDFHKPSPAFCNIENVILRINSHSVEAISNC